MNPNPISSREFKWRESLFLYVAIALIAGVVVGSKSFRHMVRESFMQRVSSAHFEILFPKGAAPAQAMEQLAMQQETELANLEKRLGDSGANVIIRVVLDPNFGAEQAGTSGYLVSGTTIRAKLDGPTPQLPAQAVAAALLHVAWGKPGNPQIDRWTAIWLTGDWRGAEIGMAAARVEQKIGHQKLATVLASPADTAPDDQLLLGAAWISEIAEFGGTETIRKLYRAKMTQPTVPEITKVLDTAPLELERKWQLWMYAYLAGMPANDSTMPPDMPMAHVH